MRSPAVSSARIDAGPDREQGIDLGADFVAAEELEPGGEQWRGAEPGRLRYVPGLDGLRAVAVVAVLLYHANLTGLFGDPALAFPGGFLGVEVFFVVSGYLITSLLLSEWRGADRVALGNFWLRRARRLLPALFGLLVTVMVVALLFYPDEVASLRGDVLSAVFYVTNWNFILADKSYFEAIGRPSLVQHLWSLAVEEQFYLWWPLVFTFGMRRLGARRLAIAVAALAGLSALWMWILFDPTPGVDPSRVFMGTDTRASALLIGCVLAFVWPQWRLTDRIHRGAVLLLDGLGVVSVLGLLVLFWTVGEYDPWLYPAGFLLCSLLSVGAIAVVVHPAAHLGPALGNRLFRWVGVRSYGIYLWHWPIFMITRPGVDVQFEGVPLLAFRFGLTFLVAAISYRYLEEPIRQGAIGRVVREYRSTHGAARQQAQFRLLGSAAAGVAVIGIITVAAVGAQPKDYSYLLNAASTDTTPQTVDADDFAAYLADGSAPDAGTAGSVPSSTVPSTTTPPTTAVDAASTTVPPPATTTAPTIPLTQRKVVFLGDSVMLGAKNVQAISSYFGSAPVDAVQNRQVADGVAVLRTWAQAGWLDGVDAVVIHLGTNGTFTDAQFDQIMTALDGVPKVVFVNDKVPQRSWEGTNNQVIAAGVARYPGRAVLVDWYSASANRPEMFYDDGTHLKADGAAFYAQLIAGAI